MLRSWIHLDFTFVLCNRYGCICILLHAGIQLDQPKLLKMLFLFHWLSLASLSKNQVSIGMRIDSSVLNYILFIILSVSIAKSCSFSYYFPIVNVEVSDGDTSTSSFIIQDYFSYHGLFVCFHIKLKNGFFFVFVLGSVKYCVGISEGNSLNLQSAFGKIANFTLFINLIHVHGILCIFSYLFQEIFKKQHYPLLYPATHCSSSLAASASRQ